jgi:hypothetical protein
MQTATTATKTKRFLRNPNANYGIQLEPIPGINLSASQMTVSHSCDRRYHQFNYQTVAVNYTGGAAEAISAVTGAGTGGTATITVNGFQVPVSAAVNTGGSGYVTGDIVTVADATGAGQLFTATAASGAITALAPIANSATPTPIDPRLVINVIQVTVGTTIVLQTNAAMEIFRALFNKQLISYGQLPIYFTEPWRNLTDGRSTSWDMAGQTIFNTKFLLNQGYVGVAITGVLVYDYIRNTVAGEIDQVTYQAYLASGTFPAPMLKIIKRQLLTPTLNGGQTIIQPQLIPTGWPILRMHFFPANSGSINQILMKADTQLIQQGQIGETQNGLVPDQLFELLTERNFNTSLAGNDYSYIADYDQRTQNKLKVTNLQLTLQSAGGQQGLTILLESLESTYS